MAEFMVIFITWMKVLRCGWNCKHNKHTWMTIIAIELMDEIHHINVSSHVDETIWRMITFPLWIKVCPCHNFLKICSTPFVWLNVICHRPFIIHFVNFMAIIFSVHQISSMWWIHVVFLICVFQFPPYVLRFCEIPSMWSKFSETQLFIWPLLLVLSISIHEQTCFHPSSSFISVPN